MHASVSKKEIFRVRERGSTKEKAAMIVAQMFAKMGQLLLFLLFLLPLFSVYSVMYHKRTFFFPLFMYYHHLTDERSHEEELGLSRGNV